MKRAALALLLLASPASATLRYVSTSGVASWAASTSSGTPCALSTANANAVATDTVMLAAGITYGAIAPATAAMSVWIGNTSSPSTVMVTGVTPQSSVRVYGVKITSSLTIPNGTTRFVLGSFVCSGGLNVAGADNCKVYGGTFGSNIRLAAQEGAQELCDADTLDNITVTASTNTTWGMTCGIGKTDLTKVCRVQNSLFRNVTLNTSTTSTEGWSAVKLFQTYGCTFRNFTVNHTQGATSDASGNFGRMAFIVRDSCPNNAYRNLRIVVTPVSSSSIASAAFFLEGGSRAGYTLSNTLDSCYFKTDRAETGCLYLYDALTGWSVTNTQAICRTGYAYYYAPGVTYENTVFAHNTFYSEGDAAMRMESVTGTATASRWAGNLFYSGSSSACVRKVRNNANPFREDSSATYNAAADSLLHHGESGCMSRSGYLKSTGLPTGGTPDLSSRWASPSFVSTTWGTIDLHPQFGAEVLSAVYPDGYAGALQYVTAGDATPPAQVTDLSGAVAGPDEIDLTWTAAGDDGASGTAAYWQLRRSSSSISTEPQWSAATLVETRAAGPGGSLDGTSPVGLSPSTTYYFAVRYYDEAGNAGAISNSPSYVTNADPDVLAPNAISDLRVSAATANSLTLAWTAPGDDGASGTVSLYRVLYGVSPADISTVWPSPPTPVAAGGAQSVTITGLVTGQAYYFRVYSQDEVRNTSPISNLANGTTTIVSPPPASELTITGNVRPGAGVDE